MNNILNLAAESIIGLTENEKAIVLHESGQVLPGLLKDIKEAVEIHGYSLSQAMAEMTKVLELKDSQVVLASNLAMSTSHPNSVLLFLFWSSVICCFNHMGLPLSAIKSPAVN